jgi:hypothetical protein
MLNVLSELITCRLVTRNTSIVSQLDGEDEEVTPLSPLDQVLRVAPSSFLEVARGCISRNLGKWGSLGNVRVKVYFNAGNS